MKASWVNWQKAPENKKKLFNLSINVGKKALPYIPLQQIAALFPESGIHAFR